jgi:hypothetical protein
LRRRKMPQIARTNPATKVMERRIVLLLCRTPKLT